MVLMETIPRVLKIGDVTPRVLLKQGYTTSSLIRDGYEVEQSRERLRDLADTFATVFASDLALYSVYRHARMKNVLNGHAENEKNADSIVRVTKLLLVEGC